MARDKNTVASSTDRAKQSAVEEDENNKQRQTNRKKKKLTSIIMHQTNPDNAIVVQTKEVLDQPLRVEPAPAEADVDLGLDGRDHVPRRPAGDAEADGRDARGRRPGRIPVDGHVGPRG
ncbi:hypothetical protein CIB48_g12094 [Xylaria polymorpha]|nr:hypothetical protein CIB48_g12094 [Xylaria polymorpha]